MQPQDFPTWAVSHQIWDSDYSQVYVGGWIYNTCTINLCNNSVYNSSITKPKTPTAG